MCTTKDDSSTVILDYIYDYSYDAAMKTVSKGVLKARLLEIFRELESSGGELIVTDFNRPVLRVEPYRPRMTVEEAFGALRTRCQVPEVAATSTWNDWPS